MLAAPCHGGLTMNNDHKVRPGAWMLACAVALPLSLSGAHAASAQQQSDPHPSVESVQSGDAAGQHAVPSDRTATVLHVAQAEGADVSTRSPLARDIEQLKQLNQALFNQQSQLQQRITELEQKLQRDDVAAAPFQTKPIAPNALPGTRFFYSGFIKLDAIWSDYRDGEIPDWNIGRDFYLPATIPVGGAAEGVDFDSHIKQSRFIFGTDTDLEGGTVSSRLEVDLYGSAMGDERATNTYGVQLRHAYVQYRSWLIGQTWSNFMDAGALPESADFIGPTEGTVFVRQPQVRYTRGNLSFSAENPETTMTPFGGGARVASDDNSIPDLTAAYTFKFANGYLRTAALLRELKYQTTGVDAGSNSTEAFAVSLTGKFNFGPHDLRLAFTTGEGLGRYVGVNFNNDAQITADGSLETISGWAAFAAWRQVWNPRLRSNFMVSAAEYDNDLALAGPGASKGSWSWAVNTMYSPLPKFDVGLEWRQAERELESGDSGSLRRLHAIARYSF